MLSSAQVRKLNWITNRIDRIAKSCREPAMIYRLEPCKDGKSFVFVATNATDERPWHEALRNCFAILGPNGGIKQYDGNIKI